MNSNFQVQMERLSFISGSSANEEEDEDDLDDEDLEEDPMAVLLPPPPLPPKPSILMNQLPRHGIGGLVGGNHGGPGGPLSYPATVHREATPVTPIINATPSSYGPGVGGPAGGHRTMYHYSEDPSEVGTVRRKQKRDRNRTTASGLPVSSVVDKSEHVQPPSGHKVQQPISASQQPPILNSRSTSKSRSKSRSPGRPIEGSVSASASAGGSSARSSRPCSLHASRGNSPDNISGTAQ